MSYVTKYRALWTDILGVDWKIDIEQDGYTTPIYDMQCTNDPLRIEYLSSTDDIHQDPIKGSRADLHIYSDTNFQYAEFYSVDDQEYRMSIYYDDSGYQLFWRGFVVSDNYSEPYDGVTYPVTISASDGLGALKDYLYKYQTTDPDDTYYTGRRLESQIIIDCLGKIGATGFTEHINIYEESMNVTGNDSPINQLMIDTDVFKDKYCYDVLSEVLNKYDANIRQIGGQFIIYRPVELSQAVIYGRVFTDAYTKTTITTSTEQFINRVTTASDLHDYEGGDLSPVRPAKTVVIHQDYGNKESWIDNYDFKADTYDTGTNTFDFWTGVSCIAYLPSYFSLADSDGMLIDTHNTSPNFTKYMTQTFGQYALATTQDFILSMDYAFYNSSVDVGTTHLYVDVIASNGQHLHQLDTEVYEWDDATHHIDCGGDAPNGFSGWITLEQKVTSIPSDGPLEIRVYGLWDSIPTVRPVIKNIKFYAISETINYLKVDGQNKVLRFLRGLLGVHKFVTSTKTIPVATIQDTIVEKTHTGTNNLAGINIEYDCLLGDVYDVNIDNIIEQFAGSLATVIRISTGTAVDNFITAYDPDYTGITLGHVMEITGEGLTFEGTDNNNFTGSTSITNLTGNITGTVSTITAFDPGRVKIVQVLVTGSSGACDIIVDAESHSMPYDAISIPTSIDAFIALWGATYTSNQSVVLTRSGADKLIITGQNVGDNFSVSDGTTSGNLLGTVSTTQTSITLVNRLDEIIVTGDSGTANILCDGVTRMIEVTETLQPAVDWNTTDPGGESTFLIAIIKDEITAQYARARVQLTLPVREYASAPCINLMGCMQDDLNQYGGNNRLFVFNKGVFNVRDREWSLDLVEIL